MMIERHYDEEALIALLESNRAGSDEHLQSCNDCTGKLESFQLIAEALQDRDVWDAREVRSEAVPATIATLRAFADRMAEEDSAAESLLTELLAGDRETWLPRLGQHPEWRTAGVVRKLIEAASRAIDTMPPDAVEMTALATEIAEALDPAAFPSDTIARLRGAAWRERAYALYYTGRFLDAEAAVGVAEGHFERCTVADYERGRLDIVRSIVCRSMDRVNASISAATSAIAALTPFGDVRRVASAHLTEAFALTKAKDFRRALKVLLSAVHNYGEQVDADTRARLSSNLAVCYRELGDNLAALEELRFARTLFTELEIPTEVARVSWNISLILMSEGRHGEAERGLRAAVSEFEMHGMMSASAIARLHLAELLLETGRASEVGLLCQELITFFNRTGLAYSQRALTALSYLKEVTDRAAATKEHVTHVREYVAALPRDEKLLFLPLPQ